jgi:hypothetical protein
MERLKELLHWSWNRSNRLKELLHWSWNLSNRLKELLHRRNRSNTKLHV